MMGKKILGIIITLLVGTWILMGTKIKEKYVGSTKFGYITNPVMYVWGKRMN